MFTDRTSQHAVVLGNHRHRYFVYEFFGNFGPNVDPLFTDYTLALWIRNHAPELAPKPDPAGNPPSDHLLAKIFKYNFETAPSFRYHYRTTLLP